MKKEEIYHPREKLSQKYEKCIQLFEDFKDIGHKCHKIYQFTYIILAFL